MSQALDHVSCGRQGLIPQPHFIQSILEACLSPLLLNCYTHTLGEDFLPPDYSEPERGYLRIGRRFPWDIVSLPEGSQYWGGRQSGWKFSFVQWRPLAHWDSPVAVKPDDEFTGQIRGPISLSQTPLLHSSQPSGSKAVTNLASIAQQDCQISHFSCPICESNACLLFSGLVISLTILELLH